MLTPTQKPSDIENSKLIILQGQEGNSYKKVWAIFDVSPTIIQRFIAIHWQAGHPNERGWEGEPLLTVFENVHDLLLWLSVKDDEGAEFRAGLFQDQYQGGEYLDVLANMWDCESFFEFSGE